MKYQAIDSEYIREMKEYDEFLKQKRQMFMGLKYGYFVAITVIILSALFNGNLVLAQTNDIEYTFVSDELFDSNDYNPTTFNVRNQTEYTGHYNATYSFIEETIGDYSGDPTALDFVDVGYTTNTSLISIENDYKEHYKILKMVDDSVTGAFYIRDNFDTTKTDAIIEFWVLTSDATVQFEIDLYEGATYCIRGYIKSEHLSFLDGDSLWQHSTTHIIDDTWNHFKYEFDDSINEVKVTINGIDNGFFEYWQNTTVGLDDFRLFSVNANPNPTVYVDAIGYSWDDNYTIGDNLIPYSVSNSSIQETNAYEFSFTEAGIYTENEATPPFWTEIESSTYVQDGYFKIFDDTSATTDLGLYKDDFSITSGIINVSMVFEYEHSSTEEAVFYLKLFSADTTEIVRLRMYSHLFDANTINTLSYYDGASYNNITTLVKDVIYSLNVFVNGIMVILSLDGVQIAISETLADKDGLSEVRFNGNGGQYGDGVGMNRYVEFKIYSIGIYSGGISVSNDYFSSFYGTALDWDSNEYYLFTVDIEGNCSIVAGSTVAIGSPHTLFEFSEFSGIEVKNVWDEFTGGNEVEGWIALQDFNLTLTMNSSIIINSMIVSSVELTDGTNYYIAELTYDNIDISESYFYISDNNLLFTMTTDDSNLEYMEISFDVSNVVASNRSLKWSGVKSASSLEAQFKVIYTDSSYNPFELEPNYKNLAVLLPKTKTIDTFGLLISDNDNDVNDTITGFIGSFELIYVPLITTDFISISFFDALPIVVLVVVIPIALYVGFGRKKELLVPSIIAMSIFGTAVGLIPLWLTFVIGFGCVAYYIMDRRN